MHSGSQPPTAHKNTTDLVGVNPKGPKQAEGAAGGFGLVTQVLLAGFDAHHEADDSQGGCRRMITPL